jgi:hypothetical protein
MGKNAIRRGENRMYGGSVRQWVREAERNRGERPGLTTDERQGLKQLERDNFELKRDR